MSSIDQLLKGAIDFHVHAAPDIRERRLDALQLARQAEQAGMKAVVLKSHCYPTAPLAYIVNQIVPGILVIGSLCLNKENGGLNPEAVEVSAKLGAKVIWMPTFSSVVDKKRKGESGGIYILDKDNQLVPEMKPILEIIESNHLLLATGHISSAEIFTLTDEARRMGIRVVITHPLTETAGCPLTTEQQQALVAKGAFIEHCFNPTMPLHAQRLDPMQIVKAVREVGVEHCILSTDFGQPYNPAPVEGVRMMIAAMLQCGLNEREVELLVKVNPAQLLDLT